MEKLNVTKGEWQLGQETSYNGNKGFEIWYNNDGECIADCVYKKDDAILIADAGTTYNQCEKLPSELLAENNELFADNKELIECLTMVLKCAKALGANEDWIEVIEARQLINKAINKLTK